MKPVPLTTFEADVQFTHTRETRVLCSRAIEHHYHARDARPRSDKQFNLLNPDAYVNAVYRLPAGNTFRAWLVLWSDGVVRPEGVEP